MSVSILNKNYNCVHSNHLFSRPFCEDQSLLKRIANVAFHVLTLGIPLVVYHIVSCCYAKISSKQKNEHLQKIAINSILQHKSPHSYPSFGQEALDFARKKLQEHPDITPREFSAGWYEPKKTNQPVNPAIAYLTTLYWDIAVKDFEKLMKKNKVNPWNNPEVIKAADECMKIAYAISNLTLDDLKSFTEALASKSDKRTYEEALTRQDSYQYRTFYYCTDVYHWLRGEFVWGADPWNQEGLLQPKSISEPHAQAFYQEGTIQNSWNKLYNSYCDRVRLCVDEERLRSADQRHLNWTEKDTESKVFHSVPDTQPT